MARHKVDPEREIVNVSIQEDGTPAFEPYARPDKLHGTTYKIKPPTMEAALYITINDMILDDGRHRPLEIFLNTKDTTHAQWMVAIARLLSALFRQPLPFQFAIQELQEVVDPKGSYFIPGGGGQCGGIVAHIGKIVEQHCIDTGAIKPPAPDPQQRAELDKKAAEAKARGIEAKECPKCHQNSMVLMDGCLTCTACGESKCG